MSTAALSHKFTKQWILFAAVAAILGITAIASYAVWSLPLSYAVAAMAMLMAPFVYSVLPQTRQWLLTAMLFFYLLNIDETTMLKASPGGADGFALDLVDIFMVLLLVLTLVRTSRSKQLGELRFFPALMLPSLAMLVMMAISLVNAQDLWWSGFDLLNMAKTILFFFVLANNIRSRQDMNLVLIALFAGVIVQTAIAAAVTYNPEIMTLLKTVKVGGAEDLDVAGAVANDFYRSGGTLGNANHLGRYFGLILPISLALALTRTDTRMNRIAVLISGIGMLGVINTMSRSAWVGIAFSFMMIVPLIFKHRHFTLRTFVKLGSALLVAALMLAVLWEPIYERITRPDNGSANTRITTAKVALRIIEDFPLFGCGINNYGAMLDEYWIAEDSFTRKAAVHNNYLLYAAETGLLGLTAYLWLLIAFFARLRRAMASPIKHYSVIAIGMFTAYGAYLLEALSDKSYKENYMLLLTFWALLAITEAIIRLSSEPSNLKVAKR